MNVTDEMAEVPTLEQVRNFARIIADPDDIVELRLIRRIDGYIVKKWCKASELPAMLRHLQAKNQEGYDIYLGANARRKHGVSGDTNVALARSVFCDCDPDNGFRGVGEFLNRVAAAKIPEPSAVVDSGHGCWAYWRLQAQLRDLAAWRAIQNGLVALLGTDSSVTNPERIVRLPGFMNWKPPKAQAFLWSVNTELVYLISVFDNLPKPTTKPPSAQVAPTTSPSTESHSALMRRARVYVAAAEGVGSGNRNKACFRLAGHLSAFVGDAGEVLNPDQIVNLVSDFNRRCQPPLEEAELEKVVQSALQHGKPREPKPPRPANYQRQRLRGREVVYER